jgi:CRP-like cAMP-binding protein
MTFRADNTGSPRRPNHRTRVRASVDAAATSAEARGGEHGGVISGSEARQPLLSFAVRPHGAVAVGAGCSPAALEAWAASFLGTVIPSVGGPLLEDAHEQHVAADETLRGDGSLLAVIASGLLRLYAASPSGRQVTIHYLSAGDVLGVPSAMSPAPVAALGLHLRALMPTHLVHFAPERFRALVALDPQVGVAVCEKIVEDLLVGQRLLVENVFLPVRQRVARHLLDLAVREDGVLIVHATQQDLADAIGSVREVVSRAVMSFRERGLLRRAPRGLVVCDPAGLHRESIA